jgi:hypothetical protein
VNVPIKSPQARWVVWLVGAILVVSFVWSQFSVRAEVSQTLRSRCEGSVLRLSHKSSWGIGENTWSDRSVFVCLRNMKSYEISASSSTAPRRTESASWWPVLWLLLAVGWLSRTLWVLGQPSRT